MASKESFFIGDSPTLIFECRQPDPYAFNDSDGLPANPYSAEYKVFNKTTAELFEEDDVKDTFGVDDGYIEIEPANEAEDRGAILTVRFPASLFNEAGSYTLYLTTMFKDDPSDPDEPVTRITEDYGIKIAEYR